MSAPAVTDGLIQKMLDAMRRQREEIHAQNGSAERIRESEQLHNRVQEKMATHTIYRHVGGMTFASLYSTPHLQPRSYEDVERRLDELARDRPR